MNAIHKRRLYLLGLCALGLALASTLILYALKQNINVFLTPNQLSTVKTPTDYRIRLGGLVKKGSVKHSSDGLSVQFVMTDFKREILVNYSGILPDLFREGKGVVAEGYLNRPGNDKNAVFTANVVLAKHDENYMPKNVYKALREGAA